MDTSRAITQIAYTGTRCAATSLEQPWTMVAAWGTYWSPKGEFVHVTVEGPASRRTTRLCTVVPTLKHKSAHDLVRGRAARRALRRVAQHRTAHLVIAFSGRAQRSAQISKDTRTGRIMRPKTHLSHLTQWLFISVQTVVVIVVDFDTGVRRLWQQVGAVLE